MAVWAVPERADSATGGISGTSQAFAVGAAVRSGGGELCASEEANAIVWAADDPPAIRQHLTPEVRWVQRHHFATSLVLVRVSREPIEDHGGRP